MYLVKQSPMKGRGLGIAGIEDRESLGQIAPDIRQVIMNVANPDLRLFEIQWVVL